MFRVGMLRAVYTVQGRPSEAAALERVETMTTPYGYERYTQELFEEGAI